MELTVDWLILWLCPSPYLANEYSIIFLDSAPHYYTFTQLSHNSAHGKGYNRCLIKRIYFRFLLFVCYLVANIECLTWTRYYRDPVAWCFYFEYFVKKKSVIPTFFHGETVYEDTYFGYSIINLNPTSSSISFSSAFPSLMNLIDYWSFRQITASNYKGGHGYCCTNYGKCLPGNWPLETTNLVVEN